MTTEHASASEDPRLPDGPDRWPAVAPGILAAVLCFLVHLALVAHHTCVTASRFDTVIAPPQPAGNFGTSPLGVWSNSLGLNRWDALLYELIATKGYPARADDGELPPTLTWFPGYPLLVRATMLVTGQPAPVTLGLVSAVSTLSFWLLLWSPALRHAFGERSMALCSVLILIYPGAFFWFAGMTEPLTGLLTLVIVHGWITGRRAVVLATLALATLIKQVFAPVGLTVVALEALRSRPKPWVALGWLVAAWAGLIAHSAHCWIRYGDALAYVHTQALLFGKAIRLDALLDLPHLVRHAWTLNGGTALAALLFTGVTAAAWVRVHGPRKVVGDGVGARSWEHHGRRGGAGASGAPRPLLAERPDRPLLELALGRVSSRGAGRRTPPGVVRLGGAAPGGVMRTCS
ncbi:MAG: hypothetical protein HY815_14285 [Candidatus Riflebacteria bacterium]|nr:hypothetical protein [Candidatus Riflebacteria bacterium]